MIKYDIPEELIAVFKKRKDELVAKRGQQWFDELLEGKHSLSDVRRAMLPMKPKIELELERQPEPDPHE